MQRVVAELDRISKPEVDPFERARVLATIVRDCGSAYFKDKHGAVRRFMPQRVLDMTISPAREAGKDGTVEPESIGHSDQ
jgi:hypothetical protein